MRQRCPARVPVLLGGLVAVLAACGIQPDDRMTPLAAEELAGELRNTTTTSTTTTTTAPPTSTDPPEETDETDEPELTTSTTTTTTSLPSVLPVQPTDVFYVYFGSDSIEKVPLNLPYDPVLVQHLVSALEDPPATASLSSYNLTTAVQPGLIAGEVEVERGVAIVELDESVLSAMSPTQQQRAIAQIVLTLTLFRTAEGNIGQVRFMLNGEPVPVFVPALGATSSEPVAFTDFDDLLTGTETEPTTTPPTSTTPIPDSEPPPDDPTG